MASAPAVVALEQSRRARGLRVVSVSVVSDRDDAEEVGAVRQAASREHMPYPCYLDEGGAWSVRAQATSIPAFLVVGKDGRLRARVHGKLAPGNEPLRQLEAAVDDALAH
jgi:hypothetical protein